VTIEEPGGLEEKLEILSDCDAVAALRESEEQIAAVLDEIVTDADARVRWIR
jgi:hypothetical protein